MPGKSGSDIVEKREQKKISNEYVFHWSKERKKIRDEYAEKLKAETARFNTELAETTKRAKAEAEAEKKAMEAKRHLIFEKNRKDLTNVFALTAKDVYPLPKIVINFDADGDENFTLGKTDEETEAKIEALAGAAVKTDTVAYDLPKGSTHAREVTTTTISFTKVDARSMAYIKNDNRMKSGKPVTRSKEFTAMQKAINAFEQTFGGKTGIGEDYLSSIEDLVRMKEVLQDIADTSKSYYDTHTGYRFTTAGKQRVQMARNTYAMAMSKLQAIDEALRISDAAENAENGPQPKREAYVSSSLEEMAQKVETTIENEKRTIDRKVSDAEEKVKSDHAKAEKDLRAQEKRLLMILRLSRKRLSGISLTAT